MSEYKLLNNACKYIRKSVTERHNKKSLLSSLSEAEKSQVRRELQDHLELLKEHNADIQILKWREGEDENWLKDELVGCENYFGKIRECLALLN